MAISLYHATVPQFLQMVTSTLAFLDKAEGWAKEKGLPEQQLFGTSLAPDMWPLGKQFQVIATNTASAMKALESGVFLPDLSDGARDFVSLRTMLQSTRADLTAADPAKIDGAEDADVALEVHGKTLMRFKGADFLLSFCQPNFYFHVATSYAILRHLGMPLGKRDFVGMPRMQQPA
jgi:hypothetical protein